MNRGKRQINKVVPIHARREGETSALRSGRFTLGKITDVFRLPIRR
jgi:hypothetical protein